MKTHYPICDKCGVEINPHKYEDCEKFYISNNETLCRDCFLEEQEEYLRLNLDDFAALVGATVTEVLN